MEPFFGRCGREIHSSDVRSAFSGCQAGIASLVGAFSEALNQTGSCVSSSAFAVNWAQTYSGLFATCKYTQVILYPRSQFNSGLMISRESWDTISVTLILKRGVCKLVFGECRHRFCLNSDASLSGTFCALHCIVLEDIASCTIGQGETFQAGGLR